jgi:hypothetical protein
MVASRFRYAGFPEIQLGILENWTETILRNCSNDIRAVWEAHRGHQLVELGIAYRRFEKEGYAIRAQLMMREWTASNPVGSSPAWDSPMEVSIRLVNWIAAFEYIKHSPSISDDFAIEYLSDIRAHADYVKANLEYAPVPNNHLISDGVGLVHAGVMHPELAESGRWLGLGASIVFEEFIKQTYDDGASYEGSIPYHGFVLELVLTTWILCDINGINVPPGIPARIEDGLDFVQSYTRSDGSYPLVGDDDGGRFVPFGDGVGDSHRHLLSVGAVLFDRSDFKQASGSWGNYADWLLGDEGRRRYDGIPSAGDEIPTSRGFNSVGVFVMRTDRASFVIDCGPVGLKGRGGHGHNDCLSFDLFADGAPLLIDAGTYGYAISEQDRNWYRSAEAHNTATVDGQDSGTFRPGARWEIINGAAPTLERWETGPEIDEFVGSHDGFDRLPAAITFRRQIRFDRERHVWFIVDMFDGSGTHQYDIRFHFAPQLEVHELDDRTIVGVGEGGLGGVVIVPGDTSDWELHVEQGWVSRYYGSRAASVTARFSAELNAPAAFTYAIGLVDPGAAPDPGPLKEMLTTLSSQESEGVTA